MRVNLPVTLVERHVPPGEFIVSRTDLKGRITYVNETFLKVSGFTEDELMGKAHNIVRHPDMPAEGFHDLWDTLHAGRPWTGYVKNRAKTGDFYWVLANVTPLWEGDAVVGYLSVRTGVDEATSRAVDDLYRAVREGTAKGLQVHEGNAVSSALHARFGRAIANTSVTARVAGFAGTLAACQAAAWLAPAAAPWLLGASVAIGAALTWRVRAWIGAPLAKVAADMREISRGNMDVATQVGARNEIGEVLTALKSLHIRLGYELAETRRSAQETLRVKQALDVTSTNVMMADADNVIRYVNGSLTAMLRGAEADIRRDLPAFDAGALIGASIDQFHRKPEHQRAMLAGLRGTHQAQIAMGGRTFSLMASPIDGERGERLGTVVEWKDRTAEVAVEREVAALVAAAAHGDFSHRIAVADKSGFFRVLAEGLNKLLDTATAGLEEVAAMLAAIAQGDLTQRIDHEFEGVFARLRDDANATSGNLAAIVAQIREASGAVSVASNEIAAGNMDLSGRTEQQASSLEETASSMEQITATVKQNADNARQANQLAIGASDVATRGGTAVKGVVTTMDAISESAKKIVEIIAVIDGIAFQTNILALNAAVEAARAGEQGRGFAVVASEVRSLAQRAGSAAREIRTLIDESVQRIASGAAMVNDAGQTIGDVVEAVRKVTDIIGEITSASAEQAAGIEQVGHAITQMDQATQQNAALVEQAAAAASSMKDQAASLERAVSVFRVDTGPAAGNAVLKPVSGAPGTPVGVRRPATPAASRPAAAQRPAASKHAAAKVPPKKAAAGGGEAEWSEF